MLQTDIDTLLKTDSFKETLQKADFIAEGTGRDPWPVRVGIISLYHGVHTTKRYVSRRAGYQVSPGWQAYLNLCNAGIIHGGEIYWTDEDEESTWGQDPHRWLFQVIDIAGGQPVPEGFPRHPMARELG